MLKHRNDWFTQKWSFSLLGKWSCGMWTLVSSSQRASDQINSLSAIFSTGSSEDMLISIFQGDQSSHALEWASDILMKLLHVTVSVPGVQHIFTSWLLTDHQYCKACLRATRMLHLCSTHCFPVFWGPCDRQRPRQLIERSAYSNRILLKSLSHIPWHGKKNYLLWPLVKWMSY